MVYVKCMHMHVCILYMKHVQYVCTVCARLEYGMVPAISQGGSVHRNGRITSPISREWVRVVPFPIWYKTIALRNYIIESLLYRYIVERKSDEPPWGVRRLHANLHYILYIQSLDSRSPCTTTCMHNKTK